MSKYAVSGVLGTANTRSQKKQSKAVKKVVVSEFDKENVPCLRRSKRKAAVSGLLNYAETHDKSKTSKSLPVKPKSKKIVVKQKKVDDATSVKKPDSDKSKLRFPSVTSGKNKTDIIDPAVPEKIAKDDSTTGVTEDSGFDSFNEGFKESAGSETESLELVTQPGPSKKQDPNNLITEERLKEFRSIVCKLFMKRHVESLPMSDLMDFLEGQKPNELFTNEEIKVALDKMTDANQVMIAYETVYLI